jgi:D-arabinose 1-dehydrogenase-like Zn-dependent alcohol dehydrogenase
MNGRVAVLKAYGGEFELREYPVPEVEPGAILIKLTRAGICGSDLHIWRGEMKVDRISEAFRQADWLAQGGDPLRISRAAIAC